MNRRQVEDIYPLSPTQQGMLFHTLSAPGSDAYFEQLTCELAGDLDATLFERAWRQVLARHPALRSAFDWESMDEPVQVVIRDPDLPFEQQDWRRFDEGEQRSRLRSTIESDRARGFDVAAAPLVRIALFRTGERRFRLVWSHHHLILDGWSMPILFREFFAYYRAGRAGVTAALPPPRPYRDYIAWLGNQHLAAAAAFWRHQLAGFAAPTPIGRGRRAQGDGPPGTYAERELRLAPAATAALQALAQRYQVTLNSLIETCWALLLSRHSGERDVLFGVVVSGRPAELAEVESMVGLFLNTLALRLELGDREPLMPFVRGVQAKLTEILRYEWSPLADVQGWSDVARGLPLFESIVVFQNYPVEAVGGERGDDLAIHDYQVREHTNYPLNLLVGMAPPGAGAPASDPPGAPASDRPGAGAPAPAQATAGLVLAISYDTLRFDGVTVEEMLRQLRGLLEQATRSPEAPLDSFSLITPEARLWLPDPALPIPAPRHDPVARQLRLAAARWHEAPAIEQGARAWSYGELAEAAEALARRLAGAGISRGEPVAVRGARSFGLMAGAAGVLLAGGALLPLDRRLPAERQRRMLDEARVRLLLWVGEPPAADDGLAGLALTVLEVDPDSGRPGGSPDRAEPAAGPGTTAPLPEPAPGTTEPLSEPGPDDPAYVFFTSGTTGVPKAVVGRQSGLAHFLDWQRATFGVGPGDRVAQLTGLSFDVVLRDIFLPLTSGAVLCLPDEDLAVAAAETPAWLARSGVTLLHTVPSLALAWIASAAGEVRLSDLRCVFFAGEPLTAELVNRWRAAFGFHGEVVNLYGPTETTLAKCWHRVPPEPRPGVQPLGTPLPDTQVLILAGGGRLCGALETGEIVVRTPFRTLGFLQPETGEQRRFVANPFRDDPADLLYRSGDLGRCGADGLLEILGRRDGQLKVRGVRVEPAEIERALRRHPGVREVVVVADGARGGRLVACVVPHAGGSGPSSAELTRLARESLPEPLVPSHFVLVAELPLTVNGKLDRERLLDLAGSRRAADAPAVTPRDPIELEIAAIWEEMLGTPVGVTESFFTLGGHSLLVAPMLARVERRFGHKLSLAGFLPVPTVERLAAALRAKPAEIARSPLLPLRPQGSGTPLFCVHPLGGSALCYLALARALAQLLPEQPFYGLDEQFLLGSGRVFDSLEEMATTYVAAVRQVHPSGPYLLGGWSFGGAVAFEMGRQLAAQGEEVALLALFDSFVPGASAPASSAAPLDDAAIILELVGPAVELTPEMLRGLAPDEQLGRVLELGRRSNLLPPDYEVETLRELVAIVRMNGRLVQRYRPRPYPGSLTFFKAQLDADADGDERQSRNLEGWRALTTGELAVRPVAATHRAMVYAPQVEELAAELGRCLAAAAVGVDTSPAMGGADTSPAALSPG